MLCVAMLCVVELVDLRGAVAGQRTSHGALGVGLWVWTLGVGAYLPTALPFFMVLVLWGVRLSLLQMPPVDVMVCALGSAYVPTALST
jgi:hypothetical protein